MLVYCFSLWGMLIRFRFLIFTVLIYQTVGGIILYSMFVGREINYVKIGFDQWFISLAAKNARVFC